MERYICENVYVPLRSGPSHKSEMTSQVLFGEKYRVIDQAGKWIKVETEFDSYQGWIDTNHLQHSEMTEDSNSVTLNRPLLCFKEDKTRLVLEPGSELFNPDFYNKSFTAGKKKFTASADFNEKYISVKESISDTAIRFINSPYIWGGRVPSGIDCSGLVQLVYKIHGIKVPRDSWKQSETGEAIDFISEAQPGDLVFFDNERGHISHVGIIISSGLVIHASGRVRIDTIDHQGIFRQETGMYSHYLRLIKRIVL